MSLTVMAWAWKVQLPPTPKFVLMALADEANDEGYCYPGIRRIAEKCSINERSVRRMIGVLTAAGYLEVQARFRNGARTSNGFQLIMKDPRTNCPGGGDTDVQGGRTALSGGSGHGCPGGPDTVVRVPTTNPLFNPPPPLQPSTDGVRNDVEPATGDARGGGGLCFPEGLSVAQRSTLARLLKSVDPNDAQRLVDELAGRMGREKVHNPIRYCMALLEKLKRGEFVPEIGIPIAERRARERLREEASRAQSIAASSTSERPRKGIPISARAAFDRFRGTSNPDHLEHSRSDISSAKHGADR